MEKIKQVLSHGTKKENHGEGSHLRDANTTTQGTATSGSEFHPIYDEFASKGASTAPSSSNTMNTADTARGPGYSATDNLRPHTQLEKADENSTASIKSGVTGLPQGGSYPPRSEAQSNTVLPDRTVGHQHGSSHIGRDAALGTAALGGAGPGHGLHHQKDHEDLRAPGTRAGAHEPTVTTETDRSFPLAGGVTSRSHAEKPYAGDHLGASDQGLDTMGARDHDHGRRGLAEAAAAASGEPKFIGDPCATSDDPSSTANFIPGPHKTDTANAIDPKLHIPGEFPETPMETPGGRGDDRAEFLPGTNHQPELDSRNTNQATSQDHLGLGKAAGIGAAGAGAAGLGAYAARKHHQRESTEIESATTNNPYSAKGVDPRLDAKPRGFEEQRFDPTARTEPSPHATGHGTGLAHHSADQQTPHVSSKDHDKDHHYGRNAGLAGAGAAAAGGLYAANHRDNKEPSHIQPQASSTATAGTAPTSQHNMPYQSSQIPPESTQREHHYGRDAGLVGAGAAGAGGLHHALHRDEQSGPAQTYPTQASQAGMGQPPMVPQHSTPQQDTQILPHAEDKDHHYGRNAGLAGAGAAAAGGLYYANKHDDKQESGPASSIIGPHKSNVANVLDPRVKPDPALQGSHAKHQGAMGSTGMPGSNTDDLTQGYGENRASHPSTSLDNQRYDPTATGAHKPRKASTGDHQDHHYGRNAALGAGAGALGYEAMKHGHDSHHPSTSSTLDSASRNPETTIHPEDASHAGRNAALGAGAGALGYGAMKHGHHDHHTSTSTNVDSASRNSEASLVGPEGASHTGRSGAVPAGVHNYPPEHYPSHNYPLENYPVNKRVVVAAAGPDPVKGESHIGDRHKRHSSGTDAALTAGAGAATAGALHEGSRHYDSESRGPHVHYRNSPDASTAQGGTRDSGLGRASQGSQIPGTSQNASYDQQHLEHHHGRNAGLAAGAGAAAAGVYGASKHHDRDAYHASGHQEYAYPPQAGQMNQAAQPGPSSQNPIASGYAPQDRQRSQHHYGRDAGLTAGAGAAGAGLYGASKHHGEAVQQPGYDAQQPGSQQYNTHQPGYQQFSYPRQGETAPYGTQNQAYDDQANRDHDHHYGRDAALTTGAAGAGAYAYNKHQDKDVKNEQHALEKEQKAEQKAREKELAHERKHDQRELEKQQAAATHGTPEKKHGLFHRKSKSVTKSPEPSPRTSLEAAEGTGRTSYDSGRNKLHKNPPPGHPAWDVLNNKQQGAQHIGADGRPDKFSQDDHIHSGYYEAPHPNDQGRFVTNPESGIAGNVDAQGSAPYGAGATGYNEGAGAEGYRDYRPGTGA